MKIEIVKYEDGSCAIRKREMFCKDDYLDMRAYAYLGTIVWYGEDSIFIDSIILNSAKHKDLIEKAFNDACKHESKSKYLTDKCDVIKSKRVGSFLEWLKWGE